MAPKRRAATQRCGMWGGGYGKTEIQMLLDNCKEIIPVSLSEWNRVAERLHEMYPERNRTVESVRRKFHALVRVTGHTDSPNIPHSVIRAKQIK